MNGYIGLAARDHGSKTTEPVPLWIGYGIWGLLAAVVYGVSVAL